jgi:hypothetical protein
MLLELVEVMGRYLNPSDQGERHHDILQIVPSRPKTVNSRTPKAIHRRLRPAQVEDLVIGYKTGSTVSQLAEQFRINRGYRVQAPREGRRTSPRASPVPRADRANYSAVRHWVVVGQR